MRWIFYFYVLLLGHDKNLFWIYCNRGANKCWQKHAD